MKRLLIAVALAASAVPALPFVTSTPYAVSQATFKVATVSDIVIQVSTARYLHVRVSYPQGAGTFPLILFSHGYGGSKDGYLPLTDFWVARGYVVVQPSHPDAGMMGLGRANEVQETLLDDNLTSSSNRVADLTAVLDHLDGIETQVPDLKGKIDRSRIGAAGHSLGAYTAMLLGGATVYYKGEQPARMADPRVKAIVAMSPQGPGVQGLTADSYATIDRPMMVMTGSLDTGIKGQKVEWRKEAFSDTKAGDKYLVLLEGARHLSFTGLFFQRLDQVEQRQTMASMPPTDGGATTGRRGTYGNGGYGTMDGTYGGGRRQERIKVDPKAERKIFEAIQRTSLAFFDLYLKDSSDARAFLQSDPLAATKLGSIQRK
jgi:predicted dienelactone hydrolase